MESLSDCEMNLQPLSQQLPIDAVATGSDHSLYLKRQLFNANASSSHPCHIMLETLNLRSFEDKFDTHFTMPHCWQIKITRKSDYFLSNSAYTFKTNFLLLDDHLLSVCEEHGKTSKQLLAETSVATVVQCARKFERLCPDMIPKLHLEN